MQRYVSKVFEWQLVVGKLNFSSVAARGLKPISESSSDYPSGISNGRGVASDNLDVSLSKISANSSSEDPPKDRPISDMLLDSFGRVHTYLRVSLTERCDLRCQYCMPADGVELTSSPLTLSQDEIVRLAYLFVSSGVNKIRLTGGEPTVRKGHMLTAVQLERIENVGNDYECDYSREKTSKIKRVWAECSEYKLGHVGPSEV